MTITKLDDAPGRRAGDLARRGARRSWARPLAAAGLSLRWPGVGHAFLGRTASAVAFVLAEVALVVLSVLPGFWRVTAPVLLVLAVSAAASAAWAARPCSSGTGSGRSS